jgi:hypothetical protein
LNPVVLEEVPLLSHGKRNNERAEVRKSVLILSAAWTEAQRRKMVTRAARILFIRTLQPSGSALQASKQKTRVRNPVRAFVKRIEGVTGSEDPAETIFA